MNSVWCRTSYGLGAVDDARELVKAAAAALGPNAPLKILSVETADGETMATIRVAMMPWNARPAGSPTRPQQSARESLLQWILGEGSRWLPLYENCARGPLLLRYRDETRAPRNLALHNGRLVRYRWRGLRDLWHHDLEFAIQLLDRYERIRDRFLLERQRLASAADRETIEDEAAARRARSREALGDELTFRSAEAEVLAVREIIVPRLEPLGPPPGIFPAALRDPWLVAFEVLDTEERQKAAHNTLARTRPGELIVHLPLRSDFPEATAFFPTQAAGATHAGAIVIPPHVSCRGKPAAVHLVARPPRGRGRAVNGRTALLVAARGGRGDCSACHRRSLSRVDHRR